MKHFHINKRNDMLLTPLELALSNGHIETARMLLRAGCVCHSLFVHIPRSNYFFNDKKLCECGELLKEHCRGHFPSAFKLMGAKALCLACLNKDYEFVKWIFDQMDSYDSQDFQWFNINQRFDIAPMSKPTLLHLAARGGDERIIRLLHQHGARWLLDKCFQTPLHYAFYFGQKKAIETLSELYKEAIVDREGILKHDCNDLQSIIFGSLESVCNCWLTRLVLHSGYNPYTLKNENGRNLFEEFYYKISTKEQTPEKLIISTTRLNEFRVIQEEFEGQCYSMLQTALIRGDRKTAVEMFEFRKKLVNRRVILSINPLICYEAARHQTLDLILQYLECFDFHDRKATLWAIGLAAIEANLEDFIKNMLLLFQDFELNAFEEILESWLEKCLLLKRRNLFLSLMKAIMKGPETSESVHLPLTIRQGPWNDLTALAARTQQSVELEMLLQYGTISFSELFKQKPTWWFSDVIILAAYSTRNKEIITLVNKYIEYSMKHNQQNVSSTTTNAIKSEPCECKKVSCKWNCGVLIPQCLEEDHLEVCLKREIKCPVKECGKVMPVTKFAFHFEKECKYLFCKLCSEQSLLFTREQRQRHWEEAHQRLIQSECHFCKQVIPISLSYEYGFDRALILNNNHHFNHFYECPELFLFCPNCECSVAYRLWNQHKCTRVGKSLPRSYL